MTTQLRLNEILISCLLFFVLLCNAVPATPSFSLASSQTTPSPAISSLDDEARLSKLEAQYSTVAAKLTSEEAALSSQGGVIASFSADNAHLSAALSNATRTAAFAAPTGLKDPSLHLIGKNWDEAAALFHYGEWTRQNREIIKASGRGEIEFYMFEIFGEHNAKCAISAATCGCDLSSLYLLSNLQAIFPSDIAKAREVYFILTAIETEYKSKCALIDGTYRPALRWCEEKFIRDSTNRQLGIYASVTMAADIAGAFIGPAATALLKGFAGVAMEGVTAVLARGGMRALRNAPAKRFWRGDKIPGHWGTQIAKLRAKADEGSWLPKNVMQTVITNLPGNTAGYYVNAYTGKIFDKKMLKNHECGVAIAEDERFSDMARMNTLLAQSLSDFPAVITLTMEALSNGTRCSDYSNGTWSCENSNGIWSGKHEDGTGLGEHGNETSIDNFSELALHLIGRFPDYETYNGVQATYVNGEGVRAIIQKPNVVDLIQKAWADQQCSLQCGPNDHPGTCSYGSSDGSNASGTFPEVWCPADEPSTICQAVCWEGGTDVGNVPLYGLNSTWDVINPPNIFQASWQMFRDDPIASYAIVEHAQVLAWGDANITHTDPIPLLAVSWSDIGCIQSVEVQGKPKKEPGRWTACNVGDRWGNLSQPFWAAGHWAEMEDHKQLAWRCRDNFKYSISGAGEADGQDFHLGVLYVNQARVLTAISYLANDTDFKEGKRERGDRERALQMLEFVDEHVSLWRNQSRSEDAIEDEITARLAPSHQEHGHAQREGERGRGLQAGAADGAERVPSVDEEASPRWLSPALCPAVLRLPSSSHVGEHQAMETLTAVLRDASMLSSSPRPEEALAYADVECSQDARAGRSQSISSPCQSNLGVDTSVCDSALGPNETTSPLHEAQQAGADQCIMPLKCGMVWTEKRASGRSDSGSSRGRKPGSSGRLLGEKMDMRRACGNGKWIRIFIPVVYIIHLHRFIIFSLQTVRVVLGPKAVGPLSSQIARRRAAYSRASTFPPHLRPRMFHGRGIGDWGDDAGSSAWRDTREADEDEMESYTDLL
ncbi:hypothetical protein LTR53_013855 [Teratosphaeriaceae sp. CCFEE 6253]|nr:hypothetical protein LTR53_013855 [Teratosphaeriaceae sp. CCFEE 6253]